MPAPNSTWIYQPRDVRTFKTYGAAVVGFSDTVTATSWERQVRMEQLPFRAFAADCTFPTGMGFYVCFWQHDRCENRYTSLAL